MKISAKAEYACLAILALARPRTDDAPWSASARSPRRTSIPERYLVQILLQLKGAGLVHSTRGAARAAIAWRGRPRRSPWARSSGRSTAPGEPLREATRAGGGGPHHGLEASPRRRAEGPGADDSIAKLAESPSAPEWVI